MAVSYFFTGGKLTEAKSLIQSMSRYKDLTWQIKNLSMNKLLKGTRHMNKGST